MVPGAAKGLTPPPPSHVAFPPDKKKQARPLETIPDLLSQRRGSSQPKEQTAVPVVCAHTHAHAKEYTGSTVRETSSDASSALGVSASPTAKWATLLPSKGS